MFHITKITVLDQYEYGRILWALLLASQWISKMCNKTTCPEVGYWDINKTTIRSDGSVAAVLAGAHLVACDSVVEGIDDLHFTRHIVHVALVKLSIFLHHLHWGVCNLDACTLHRQHKQQQQQASQRRVCWFPAAGHAASVSFISTLTNQPESSGESSQPRWKSDDVCDVIIQRQGSGMKNSMA